MNEKVYAFDRDLTIDTGQGPVPLQVVKGLVAEGHEVWAIGNQALCQEAGIPGVAELQARVRDFFPHAMESRRMRRLAGRFQLQSEADVLIAHPRKVERRNRLRMLQFLFPDARAFIVVDDVDLSDMAGWTYWTPEEYARRKR